NGLCHHVGYKNFDNTATNIRFIALLTGGEGLHNNHHGYPRSPKFSWRKSGRGEIDPAWPVIKLLITLHLAKPYKTIEEVAASCLKACTTSDRCRSAAAAVRGVGVCADETRGLRPARLARRYPQTPRLDRVHSASRWRRRASARPARVRRHESPARGSPLEKSRG